MTRFDLAQRLGTLLLSVSLAVGCQPGAGGATGGSSARELDGVRVARALEALRGHLGESPRLLELRVTEAELSVQLAAKTEEKALAGDAPTLTIDAPPADSQAAPSEEQATGEGDAGLASRRTITSEPSSALGQIVEYKYVFSQRDGELGRVEGPDPLPLRGSGRVDENVFPLEDVDVTAITAAFPLAKNAVDPTDGRVHSLVVRRFLPFQRAVRARIFVESPRMSGSFDTNQKGIPLRQ